MNATKLAAGGSAGGAIAAAIVYLLGRLHVNLTAEDGAVGATALIAVAAFVAHNGLVGAARLVWRGSKADPPAPPAA
jgi:hypothetical protein